MALVGGASIMVIANRLKAFVVLMVLWAFTVAPGVAEGAPRSAETWRSVIAALPVGALVEVRLQHGERIIGTLGGVTAEGFTLQGPRPGEARTFRFQDPKVVKAVKAAKNWKPSGVWWIVIGVAAAVVTVLAIMAARGGNN